MSINNIFTYRSEFFYSNRVNNRFYENLHEKKQYG